MERQVAVEPLKLIYWPAGILRKVSLRLEQPPATELVAGMKAIMRAHKGAGLSAIQVGVAQRLVVVDSGVLGPSVFVNPHILEFCGERVKMREGCLSVPGFFEDIPRAPEVVVDYYDESMVCHHEVRLHGFMAHVLQHEMEHLDGKLYLDHLPNVRRGAIMGQMQSLRRQGLLK